MRDAAQARRRTRRRGFLGILLLIASFFGMFRRREPAPPMRRVEVTAPAPAMVPPAAREPTQTGTPNDILFRGLHGDTNPSSSVRTAEMTCVQCERTFRYFVNSNGTKTLARCPGCARQFRV